MQPKQSKWSKQSRFLDVSGAFLCFSWFPHPSLESLAVFLGASAVMHGDIPSLSAVAHVEMSPFTETFTDFSRLQMQLLRAPKDERLWPQRPWRPLETKNVNWFKICPAIWGKSCLRLWKNIQAEEVAKTWKHMWPNWPLSIWLMIDLMTAFHVTSSLSWLLLGGSSSISPCVCTMPAGRTWHGSQVVTSRHKSSQVVTSCEVRKVLIEIQLPDSRWQQAKRC